MGLTSNELYDIINNRWIDMANRDAVAYTTDEEKKFWQGLGYRVVASKQRRDAMGNICRKKYHAEAVRECLIHYGNGKLACVKCGFSDERALSIDHINGGGTQERKSKGGNTSYRLKKANYPEGYQTLCMNCQFIKRTENNELRRCSKLR